MNDEMTVVRTLARERDSSARRRPESFRYRTQVRWIGQVRSEFTDIFEFESGRTLEVPFVSEIIDEHKLHVESPDMPGVRTFTYQRTATLARLVEIGELAPG